MLPSARDSQSGEELSNYGIAGRRGMQMSDGAR
jgi:hypothetical protein